MNSSSYSYKVETYALMTHVDDSIIELNSVIENYGYQFIKVNIQELENDFSDIIGLRKPYESGGMVNLEGKNILITNQFYEAVMTNSLLGHDVILHKYVVLLKRIVDFERTVENYVITSDTSTTSMREMLSFLFPLVYQIRLLKNCYIDYLLVFQVAQNTRSVVGRHIGRLRKEFAVNKLGIGSDENEQFGKMFSDKFNINDLSRIAFECFSISHFIPDIKTQFVTLMTALESIFNTGADQIAHTVSRHLALLLAKDQSTFTGHYKRIKQLYALRSKIAHGSTLKGSIEDETEELKNYVRQALLYTLSCEMSKIELFEYFNYLGVKN